MAVLKEYPPDVVVRVTHPFYGLASKHNWLPSIAEIRQACDQEAARQSSLAKHSGAVAETLARRAESESWDERRRQESRAEHVARLRAEGKLSFDADALSKSDRRSWFDRMTAAEAERKYPGISK